MEQAVLDPYPNLSKRHRWTKETSKIARAKALLVRRNNKLAHELELARTKPPTQTELNETVLRQIQDLDRRIYRAKARDRVDLVTAKKLLWSLVFAKPRPGRSSRPGSMPVARPLEDLAQGQVSNPGMQSALDPDKAQ